MAITLRAARVNKGLKLDEAAKMLGISKPTLQKYESAKGFPNIVILKRMEVLYGIKYEQINFLIPNAQ